MESRFSHGPSRRSSPASLVLCEEARDRLWSAQRSFHFERPAWPVAGSLGGPPVRIGLTSKNSLFPNNYCASSLARFKNVPMAILYLALSTSVDLFANLWIYISTCVFMCLNQILTNLPTHLCISIYLSTMHLCIYIRLFMCISVYIYMYVFIYVDLSISIFLCVCVCVSPCFCT